MSSLNIDSNMFKPPEVKPVQPPSQPSFDMPTFDSQDISTASADSFFRPVVAVSNKKQNLNSMYQSWKETQDAATMNQMLETLSSDIDKAVYAYVGLNAGPAVKSRAKVLAVKAIKNYAPDSGANLKSWVYTQLQPLSRYSKELAPSPMPERLQQQLSALKKHESDFYENHGRSPSEEELANLTSMSTKQIEKIRNLDRRSYSEGAVAYGGETPVTSQEMTTAVNPNFQRDVLDTMYSSLTAQEQVILEHKLGYKGKPVLSNEQIAKKLNVSPGRVSQMTASLASKLDEYAELSKGGL